MGGVRREAISIGNLRENFIWALTFDPVGDGVYIYSGAYTTAVDTALLHLKSKLLQTLSRCPIYYWPSRARVLLLLLLLNKQQQRLTPPL